MQSEEATEDVAEIFVRINNQGTRLSLATTGRCLSSRRWRRRRHRPPAFRAAQIVLGTGAFLDPFLRNLRDPPAHGTRAASEAHHLFPEARLSSRGIRERRRVNQVANLADVGWHENNVIGRGPPEYVRHLREKLAIDDDRWGRMCAEHALSLGWESMEYEEFLRERRRRMAEIIRVAFRQLGGEPESPPLTPPWFLPGAETVWQRIVETESALRAVVREVYPAAALTIAAEKSI